MLREAVLLFFFIGSVTSDALAVTARRGLRSGLQYAAQLGASAHNDTCHDQHKAVAPIAR